MLYAWSIGTPLLSCSG